MENNYENENVLKEWDYYTIETIDENSSELKYALRLVWNVFLEFEAHDYSDEGVIEFQKFIDDDSIRKSISEGELSMLGCFHYGEIVGVIAIKPPCKIALLFVLKPYHRHGIATKMLDTVLENFTADEKPKEITVNSSPYAIDIYKHMGFAPVDEEQIVNGMKFTPMKKAL